MMVEAVRFFFLNKWKQHCPSPVIQIELSRGRVYYKKHNNNMPGEFNEWKLETT